MRATIAIALLLALPGLAGAAIPTITRDQIISIAKSGVGCPYVWGGTCWDPAKKSWKGADCSGYVTKCWQIPTATKTTDCVPHYYTTSTFQNYTTHWTKISRNDLIKGDALVYNSGSAGHVILYYSGDKWGNAQVYEARGSAYGIVYRTKYVESKYVARRRNSIVSTPAVPKYPLITIKSAIATIGGQDRDFCKQGKSTSIFDWTVGQTTQVNVDIKNTGTDVAKKVKVGVWAEQPYLSVLKWNIYTDWNSSGFVLNDTDGLQSIPHDNPGKSFTLEIFALSVGETKRIKLEVKALKYSVGAVDHPDVRAWVSSVEGYYTKSSFSSSSTNVKSYQTFNGGDLRAYSQTDVLDQETCDGEDNDCDGQVDEDGVCAAPGSDGAPGLQADGAPMSQADAGLPIDPDPYPADPPQAELDDRAQLTGNCSFSAGATPAGAPLPLLWLLVVVLLLRRRR